MMLKTKVDVHVFSAVKIYFFDMLLLENIISDIEPNVSNKQEKFGVNAYSNTIIAYQNSRIFPRHIVCTYIPQ